jgi:hypothetical protein
MSLIRCPECSREVSDKAYSCPGCGHPLREPGPPAGWPPGQVWNYEYKSQKKIFGLPLVHVVYGPAWGRGLKPAKGFIAIGNIAIGVVSVGGLSAGVFCLGGIGFGLVTVAGLAFGLGLAVGGVAVGYLAVGGMAVGIYALGGLALGEHTIYNDPNFIDSLRRIFRF